ncbi:hypothetical protein [Cupriavidus campinensis]|uniref:Thioredoxin family protein n=1 Tax=Cupriavidus campinensis TaxID=151783 RepID=A0ABY3EK88_9BURK|nr:hypothetical protein [Cupriavidus campinensis]TSP11300.1 hypothetical protein FGG12_18950 [Cupriavidus campinensis]
MRREATLYHDGCKVCLSVVETMTGLFDNDRHLLTVINLEEQRGFTAQAEAVGVKRLPSLVIDGILLHVSQGDVTASRLGSQGRSD